MRRRWSRCTRLAALFFFALHAYVLWFFFASSYLFLHDYTPHPIHSLAKSVNVIEPIMEESNSEMEEEDLEVIKVYPSMIMYLNTPHVMKRLGEGASAMYDHQAPETTSSNNDKLTTYNKGNICFLTMELAGLGVSGGIGTAVSSLARLFAESGYGITVLHSPWPHSLPSSNAKEKILNLRKEAKILRDSMGIDVIHIRRELSQGEHCNEICLVSWQAYRWLVTHPDRCDLLYFHDNMAIGYWIALAKSQGLHFQNMPIVIALHGPHVWERAANNIKLSDSWSLAIAHMEETALMLSDWALSPSNYMLDWYLHKGRRRGPDKTYVLPNYLYTGPTVTNRTQHEQGDSVEAKKVTIIRNSNHGVASNERRVNEVIFYGRLEKRKGLYLFNDAIDLIHEKMRKDVMITFLGAALGDQDVVYRCMKWSHLYERIEGFDYNRTRDDEASSLMREQQKKEVNKDIVRSFAEEEEDDDEEVVLSDVNESQDRPSGDDDGSGVNKQVTDMKYRAMGRKCNIRGEYSHDEAIQYLVSKRDTALVVIPSLMENSPFTVMECIENSIHFVTSGVGGIGELIHPDDREKVLFRLDAVELSNKILNWIEELPPVVHLATPNYIIRQTWLDWLQFALVDGAMGIHSSASPVSTSITKDHVMKHHQGNQVSIIIPFDCDTHDHDARMLAVALDSITRQTHTYHETIIALMGKEEGKCSHTSLVNQLNSKGTKYIGDHNVTIINDPNRFRGYKDGYRDTINIWKNALLHHTSGEWVLFLDRRTRLATDTSLATLLHIATGTTGADVVFGQKEEAVMMADFATFVSSWNTVPIGNVMVKRSVFVDALGVKAGNENMSAHQRDSKMPCGENHGDFVRNHILMAHVPYVVVADVVFATCRVNQ